MLFRNKYLKYVLCDQAGADGGAGGGGAGDAGGDAGDAGADPGDKGAGGADKGGKSGMTDDAAELLREVMQKKERIKELEANLSKVDVDKYQKLLALEADLKAKEEQAAKEKAEAEKKRLEEAGQWDRLKEQMASEHQSALEAVKSESESKIRELTEQLNSVTSSLQTFSMDNAFANDEYVREELVISPTQARIIYGAHFEMKDGKFVAYDKPAGSPERTPLVDGAGKNLSFNDAIKKIVNADPDKDSILKSKIKPGAGSGSDPGKAKTPDKGLSGREKISQGLAALASS